MPRRYYKFNVQAEVVDLRKESPKPDDRFLIDTNVLFWYGYALSNLHSFSQDNSPEGDYQLDQYPEYIDKAIEANSQLFYCGISISEIAHIIEKSLYEYFLERSRKTKYDINSKQYRYNFPQERNKVVKKINNTCQEIEKFSTHVDININYHSTKSLLSNLQSCSIDGYDSLILEAMLNSGINQVITDDGDYITVPGIRVFTANNKLIAAAKSQGKLIQR